MVTMVNQTHICRNVFFLFLFCTLIFSSGGASTKDSEIGESLVSSTGRARRLLGASSAPPSCNSRCGNCTPCTPVLVAAPPPGPLQTDTASHRPDDYVPEVWKCTCGGKLYNP